MQNLIFETSYYHAKTIKHREAEFDLATHEGQAMSAHGQPTPTTRGRAPTAQNFSHTQYL